MSCGLIFQSPANSFMTDGFDGRMLPRDEEPRRRRKTERKAVGELIEPLTISFVFVCAATR